MHARPFELRSACREVAAMLPAIDVMRVSELKAKALSAMDACGRASEADQASRSALLHFLCGIDDLERSANAATEDAREKLRVTAEAKFRSADYEAHYA